MDIVTAQQTWHKLRQPHAFAHLFRIQSTPHGKQRTTTERSMLCARVRVRLNYVWNERSEKKSTALNTVQSEMHTRTPACVRTHNNIVPRTRSESERDMSTCERIDIGSNNSSQQLCECVCACVRVHYYFLNYFCICVCVCVCSQCSGSCSTHEKTRARTLIQTHHMCRGWRNPNIHHSHASASHITVPVAGTRGRNFACRI